MDAVDRAGILSFRSIKSLQLARQLILIVNSNTPMDDLTYFAYDTDCKVSRADLSNKDREVQLDVMRAWFFQNYEDPAERTPYESAEGGYIWIWGGPYDAREELEAEFGDVVSDDVIEALSTKLNDICWQWAPTEKPGDYDEYLADDIVQITEFGQVFSGALLDIEKMLEAQIDSSVEGAFFRLLYVNVITAMETYLSDAFMNSVVPHKELLRRLVETTPEFKTEKISLSEVYQASEGIEQRAKSYLVDVVWHNLGRIKPMYKGVLGVEFNGEMGDLVKAILKRHDIVHRNGKTKSGEEIMLTKDSVTELLSKVQRFIHDIDAKIREARANREMQPTANTSIDF